MRYSIVYSSRTGNTKLLAEAIREVLPPTACIYFGEPNERALLADEIYVGFWTDRGSCDAATAKFLEKVQKKRVFLFGTAGFGTDPSYFAKVLKGARQKLDGSNSVVGTYMCQGKMPMAVRTRYEGMRQQPNPMPNLEEMIANFDRALTHPDREDLKRLKQTVLDLCCGD